MKKQLLALFGLGTFAVANPIISYALDEGPADESAYWILKIHGELQPIPVISATEFNYGELEVGKVALKTLKITNKGYGYLIIKKVYLKGGTQFAIQKTNCTKPLDYGQSCEITVAFKPTEPGILSDNLYIVTNDKSNPVYSIPLKGIAKSIPIVVEQPTQPVLVENLQNEQPKPVEKTKPQLKKTEKAKKQPQKVKKQIAKPKKVNKNLLKPKVAVWTVKPCDTLWDISADVYGTPLLWAAIYGANRDKISDPWIIEVGTKLKIPALTPEQVKKYKEETLRLMEEMADRPLGPKCPF
jgi:hypothetical protein